MTERATKYTKINGLIHKQLDIIEQKNKYPKCYGGACNILNIMKEYYRLYPNDEDIQKGMLLVNQYLTIGNKITDQDYASMR